MNGWRPLRLAALAFALVAALVLAVAIRSEPDRADPRSRGTRYVELDDAETSYRLRLIELVLAGETPPATRDVFLDAAGSEVPWPPLVHGALAFAAAHALEHDPAKRELNGYDEGELLAFAQWIGPLLGALAALAAALAGTVLVEPGRRGEAAAAAAMFYATLPIAVAREVAGTLHAHPWVVALGFAELAALAVAVKAKERVDVTVGALVCGLFAGLGLLAGPESWPISASVLGTFAAIALRGGRLAPGDGRERPRDAWRATMLFVASGLAVVSLGRSDAAMRGWLPTFELGGAGLLASSPSTIALVLAPLAVSSWLVFRDRLDPTRAALLGAAFVSATCSLFDRRFFAPLAVCLTALVVAAAAGSWVRSSARRARAASVAYVVVLAAAVAGWVRAEGDGEETRAAAVGTMRRLRELSSSPGAFNHPDAEQSWRVASAPALAGSIAFHARRPVVAASFDGFATPSAPLMVELFSSPDVESFARALALADCPFVVVAPRMLLDPSLGDAARGRDGVLAKLALTANRDPGARIGDLELVAASERRETPEGRVPLGDEPAGPVISIWRRTRTPAADQGPRETIGPGGR